jgi:hypothetical protein
VKPRNGNYPAKCSMIEHLHKCVGLEGRKYVVLCCKSLLNYHKHKNYYGEDKGYDKL